jgi:hypothetical protein
MKTIVPGLLLLAAQGLGRCYDEDRSPTEYTAAAEKSSTSSNDTTTAPAPVVPGVSDTTSDPLPPPRAATVALSPLGQGLRGTAQLRSSGTATLVFASLSQGKASTSYDGAIRQGRCARMGANVAPLLPVTADSLGGGRAASDVPVPIDSLLGSPHVLVYGKGGRPEACGELGAGAETPVRSGPATSAVDTTPADTSLAARPAPPPTPR